MTRTLLIGLDGATFTILDRLTRFDDRGNVVMPTLKKLIERGVRAQLRSTPNPLTPPAWVSLMTGRSPGHHGVFDFLRAEERGADVYFTLSDARDVRTEMIWSIAQRQNRRVVALNFPMTAPPRPNCGCVVPGFVPWQHLRRNVAPRELFERLRTVEGFDPRGLAWDFELESKAMDVISETEVEQWVAYHVAREQQWFRIAEKLLTEDHPDLMAVMFDGTDKIQHQAWAYLTMEADDLRTDEPARRIRELCHRYFANVDAYIARLIELAGPQAQVFLASDHGFTGSREVVRINAFLEDRGYLAWRPEVDTDAERRRGRSWFVNLDWAKTLAYCRTPSSNGITIRVAQNSGDAGVAPQDYEAFRNKLANDLTQLCDEVTGERVITKIQRREDVFAGAAMHAAPDLLLGLRDFGFASIANVRPVVQQRPAVVGTHHPLGIFLASGAGICAGNTLEPCDIADVAATVLTSLNLPVPKDFEGVVPEGVFSAQFLREHPVMEGPATRPIGDAVGESGDLHDPDKEKILRQLQMLGYME